MQEAIRLQPEVCFVEAVPTAEEHSIQQGFGHTERTALAARYQPHGGIRVTRQARLKEWRIKRRDDQLEARVHPVVSWPSG